MQVEATYHQGKLQFHDVLQFKRERFKVMVDIPAQEIADSTAVSSQPESIAQRLDRLIGSDFRQGNQGKPSINAKALWHQHLEEKYLGD